MDTKDLWNHCLVEIEAEVSKANFSTWFRNTSVVKEDNGTVYVGVPNEFVKDWLSNKFHKLIMRVLRNAWDHTRSVEYLVIKNDPKVQKIDVAPQIKPGFAVNAELPLKDLYINKDDNLNPRYTFDTFIVGPFNELAYAAAQAAVARPGKQYNPLFIYGSTGLGKTHLTQAIGNAIKEKYPEKKVFYITQEKFVVDFINSVQANRGAGGNAFKEKYRKYDAIIIDDVQLIGKTEKTQEELFHLFNNFYENSKQIVFSSDKHPNFIPGLEDRMRSRFAQGMIVDITEPEYESRLAILRAKTREVGANLPDEIIEYTASVISGNVRELEGSLNVIVCQAQLKGRFPTLLETKNLLKNSIKQKKTASVKEVVKSIADFYNIEEESVYEKTRRKEIVKVRQIVMYILREDFNVSYPLIGQKLGGKDHTTVIHSCLKIKEDIKNNMLLAQEIDQIRILFK
ncbi:MAG: chromosomal replication initiator protein DnaA [Candidatus Pacebacteria bacterium]|nr:chromosomal replication initiator protein DnaA [Candidatus Paceibacterota bacterium]